MLEENFALREAVIRLSERERKILLMWSIGLSDREVGHRLCISRERARLIRNRALAIARHHLED